LPAINAAGARIGVHLQWGCTGGTVQDLEIYGASSTSAVTFGIWVGQGSSFPANSCRVLRCVVHDIVANAFGDCNGIYVNGDDVLIEDCRVYAIPDDGIWIRGNRAVVRGNHVSRVGEDADSSGDCVQLNNGSSVTCNNFVVENNVLDHSSTNEKQCFVVSGAAAVSATGGVFRNNVCVMPPDPSNVTGTSCFFSDQPNTLCYGNLLQGGSHGALFDGQFATLTGCEAVGNVCVGNRIGITGTVAYTGLRIANNTIIDASAYGVFAGFNSSTNVVSNNILLRCAVGVATHANTTRANNDYFGNGTNWESTGGGGSIEGTAVLVDPQLRGDYVPQNSALNTAGTFLGGLDFYGKEYQSPPTIGAVQYQPPRTLASKRAIAG
jgi:hypothetical protein